MRSKPTDELKRKAAPEWLKNSIFGLAGKPPGASGSAASAACDRLQAHPPMAESRSALHRAPAGRQSPPHGLAIATVDLPGFRGQLVIS